MQIGSRELKRHPWEPGARAHIDQALRCERIENPKHREGLGQMSAGESAQITMRNQVAVPIPLEKLVKIGSKPDGETSLVAGQRVFSSESRDYPTF